MRLREALNSDLDTVFFIEKQAFGSEEESNLVRDLLADESAKPVVSLLAFQGNQAVGHLLFTRARLEPDTGHSISILAPLAVVPDYQKKGIGGKLIKKGLELLSNSGVDLVFVLGHPEYYPRHGFQPAGRLGFEATYPIPDDKSDAWMVQALSPGIIGAITGKVICADAMNKSEYWRE